MQKHTGEIVNHHCPRCYNLPQEIVDIYLALLYYKADNWVVDMRHNKEDSGKGYPY